MTPPRRAGVRPVAAPAHRGNLLRLSAAQLLAGIGSATGFAVGGILAEALTGATEYAGFAQTASILGAAILAVPLARLARSRSRALALSVGFAIAALGAGLVVLGAATGSVIPFFAGMLCFGSATASGFQARYAATDTAPAGGRARAMSLVVWATTIGSVAGPNLAGLGGGLGRAIGLGEYGGSFLVSGVAFVLAAVVAGALRRPAVVDAVIPEAPGDPVREAGDTRDGGALRVIARRPLALLGLSSTVLGHTVMVSVMVMTPVHLHGHGASIPLVGLVLSLHILGMYALSPVMGVLVDRWGPPRVIALGLALLAMSGAIGLVDGLGTTSDGRVMVALTLLGLGWSACFIAGSTLLSASVPAHHRVSVQGLTDAWMSLGAAALAAVAGPLLALGGFALINAVTLGILALAAGVAIVTTEAARRAR